MGCDPMNDRQIGKNKSTAEALKRRGGNSTASNSSLPSGADSASGGSQRR
jgi:hypothetical protein